MFGTREEWLREAIIRLEVQVFQNKELVGDEVLTMPVKWQVSCGWCKGMSPKGVACCVPPEQSKDGTTHIFVIPTQDNQVMVLHHLVHEMVHAIDGCKSGHFGRFKEICTLLGLVGKPTQCGPGEGTIAHAECLKVAEALGPYPHAAMAPHKKASTPSQWVRWKSKNNPKYTVLINTKNVIRFGMPRDWKGDVMIPNDPEKVFGIKPDPRQIRLPDVDESNES